MVKRNMSEQKVKCEKCGEVVSEKVEAYSKTNFDGHVYCYKCQKKVRGDEDTGSWSYTGHEKEEQKKATSEDATDVKPTEDDELEEYDGDVTAELKAKSKELGKKIIELVTAMSMPDKDRFYAWLKTVYGVDDLETLNIEQKEAVLNETEKMVKGKKSEKVVDVHENGNKTVEIDEGTFSFQERGKGELSCSNADGNVYVINITVPECSCSQFQKDKSKRCPHLKAAAVGGLLESGKEKEKAAEPETAGSDKDMQKRIPINWSKIPVQMLIPKLRKALEYTCKTTAVSDVYRVESKGVWYDASINSCECEDWERVGSSVNPCKHMIRVKYSDEEIRAKLKELGADVELPAKRKKNNDSIVAPEQSTESIMGIHGLTPRLAEIGKIKIGSLSDKMVKGRRLPKKLDHFVVTSILRDENGDLLIDEEMTKKIGDSCQELSIYLCYDSPQLNFSTFFAHFTQSRLQCMGNGITASRTTESGDKKEITCNPKTCESYLNKQCKPYGRLSVILADSSRVGGCYVFRTTSWNSLRNILTSMSFIKTITGGILAGIKLKMTLIPMQVQPRDMGRTVKIYTVNIEYGGSWEELKDVAAKEMQRRVQLGTNMKQIESGDREMIAEQVKAEAEEQAAEISQEFAPEEEG